MLGRIASAALALAAVACAAFSVPACGTTTSVSDPTPTDAGCPTLIFDTHDSIPDPPNGAAACPSGACNYQSATGCAAGSACRPQFSADSPEVSPGCEPAGSGVVGSVCTAQSDCASGYYCGEGSCRKQCCAGDWSACDPGESCIRQVEVNAGGHVIDSGLALCFPVNDCDPLDTAPCKGSSNRECKIVDPIGNVACEPLSTAQENDSCAPPTVCAAGLTCVLGSCRKLCRTELCGEPACTVDEGSCVHLNRDPAGVGECTPGR